jgi:predicted component of type VI protein secretion system
VVSEVLRTKFVHLQLHQRASGAARIVIDVADVKSRDTIVEAIRADMEEQQTYKCSIPRR